MSLGWPDRPWQASSTTPAPLACPAPGCCCTFHCHGPHATPRACCTTQQPARKAHPTSGAAVTFCCFVLARGAFPSRWRQSTNGGVRARARACVCFTIKSNICLNLNQLSSAAALGGAPPACLPLVAALSAAHTGDPQSPGLCPCLTAWLRCPERCVRPRAPPPLAGSTQPAHPLGLGPHPRPDPCLPSCHGRPAWGPASSAVPSQRLPSRGGASHPLEGPPPAPARSAPPVPPAGCRALPPPHPPFQGSSARVSSMASSSVSWK